MKIQSMFQKDIDRPINGVVNGTPLSTNLVLSWNELRTNLRETCD